MSELPSAPKAPRAAAKNVDPAQLRYFFEILGVYRSTLSRPVHHLEDHLGVSLFEHHGQGVRLTTAGRLFPALTRRLIFETLCYTLIRYSRGSIRASV